MGVASTLAVALLGLAAAGCAEPRAPVADDAGDHAPTAAATRSPAPDPQAATDPDDTPARATADPTARSTPSPTPMSAPPPTPAATAEPAPSPAPVPSPTPASTSPAPAPAATASPSPQPTRAPTPTPAPLTPEERAWRALAELLPWFANPPDDGHAYAVQPILEVWLKDAALGAELARAPWLADGIGVLEPNAVYGLSRLFDHDPALARRMLAYSAEEPVRTRNVHTLNALGDLAWLRPERFALLQDREWFADGLSAEERAFVIVLEKVAYHDALYTDLLEEWSALRADIDLPLSGAVGLWVFGHDEIEGDVLGAMEAGARAAERVMASPFPVTDLIVLQVNAERYGGGFGGVNLRDSMVLSIGSGWEDIAHAGLLYHEVAHYHLAFEVGPHWLVEGGANFVAAYRQAWDGAEHWDGRVAPFEGNEYAGRTWCRDHGVPNVAALAQAGLPFQDSCGYHLGQYLLTALYNTVGEAAFTSAMAELHGRYLRFLPWPTEEEIYRVFRGHTPADREAALLDVYRRFHGGPFLDGE